MGHTSMSRTIRISDTDRIVVRGPRYWERGEGADLGVRVFAYRTTGYPFGTIGAARGETLDRSVSVETVWGTTRFDAAARNRIGQMGASVDVPPSQEDVEAAVVRAREALAATPIAVPDDSDVEGTIAEHAAAIVAELAGDGWRSSGRDYDLGDYSYHADALSQRLGRRASPEELSLMQSTIRRLLDEHFARDA